MDNTGKAVRIQSISLIEGAFYSLMVGLGETYLVALALSIGISDLSASYLAIVPVIVGSLLQFLFSARAMASSSKSKWLMACSGGQAAVLLSLAAIGLRGAQVSPATLGVLASLYWAFGYVAGPIWNTSIVKMIDRRELNDFFYRRNAVTHLFSLLSFIIAAFVLGGLDTQSPAAARMIAWLLLAAAAARLASMYCFALHRFHDSGTAPEEREARSTPEGALKADRPYILMVLAFVFMINLAVQVSGPFYAAYMLKELKLNFTGYCILLGSAFISRIAAGYLLNRWVRRFGVKLLLVIGTAGIAPVPVLWALSDNFYFLLGVQLLSGFAWGCHELGLTLSLIELVPHRQRSRLLTWSNLGAAIGMAIGVALSTVLILRLGLGRSTYHLLFAISSGLRGLSAVFSLQLAGINGGGRPILFRLLGIRPSGNEIMKPILLPDDQESSKQA